MGKKRASRILQEARLETERYGRLTHVDRYGNKYRASVPVVVGLGRRVIAYAANGDVIKGAQKHQDHKSNRRMNRWMERRTRWFNLLYGENKAEVIGDFSSGKEQKSNGKTVVVFPHTQPIRYLNIYKHAAGLLTKNGLGEYSIKIDTDRPTDKNARMHLIGIGIGSYEKSGSWGDFYDVANAAVLRYDTLREDGATLDASRVGANLEMQRVVAEKLQAAA